MRHTIVPMGPYCYDENGVCPYWHCNLEQDPQHNGYCELLDLADWDCGHLSLLWDQVKECDINLNEETDMSEPFPMIPMLDALDFPHEVEEYCIDCDYPVHCASEVVQVNLEEPNPLADWMRQQGYVFSPEEKDRGYTCVGIMGS